MEISSSTSESTAATGTGYPMSQEETKPTSKQFLYADIGKLPFHVYVDAVCGAIQLDNFDELQGQFNDAIGEAGGMDISKYVSIETTKLTYEHLHFLAKQWENATDEELKSWIREEFALLGYDILGDDISPAMAQVEALLLELDELLDAVDNGDSKPEIPLRQAFTETFTAICRHFKLALSFNTIYTNEFCAYYKAYSQEVSRMAIKEDED